MGCRTKSADLEGDIVEEVRTIPRNQLDFEGYRTLLNAHIHPQVKGIKFLFYADASDQAKGIGVIQIPVGSIADKPHLIAHIVSEDTGRKNTTKYALTTRTGARNSPYPVETIHGLIKIGSSVGSLETSIRAIERTLAEIVSRNEAQPKTDERIKLDANRKAFLNLLPTLMEATGFKETPAFVLAAFPAEIVECRGIYDSSAPTARAFDHPPQLREHGFDLEMRSAPEIVDGNARRKVNQAFKVTQLSVSGRLIAIVRADDDFLSWATNRRPGHPVEYRSFVLAELTYIFAKWMKAIFATVKSPNEFDILVALRNSFVDGIPPTLSTKMDHSPYSFSLQPAKSADKPNMLKTRRVSAALSVERLAFEIRALLYHRFGFGDDQIPYTTISEEGRVTTEDEILNRHAQ